MGPPRNGDVIIAHYGASEQLFEFGNTLLEIELSPGFDDDVRRVSSLFQTKHLSTTQCLQVARSGLRKAHRIFRSSLTRVNPVLQQYHKAVCYSAQLRVPFRIGFGGVLLEADAGDRNIVGVYLVM